MRRPLLLRDRLWVMVRPPLNVKPTDDRVSDSKSDNAISRRPIPSQQLL